MGHGHNHGQGSHGRAFAIGVTLNLTFVVVEFLFGHLSNSLSLVADAGHNLSDVLGLLLAWGAASLARRTPTPLRTYGLRRSSILAAVVNAVVLFMSVGAIAWESLQRVFIPEPVAGATVIWVAAIGIVVNGFTALLFLRGRRTDLNIRGAFLHMAADAAISAGVVVAGLAIMATGFAWIDPVVSLAIAAIIVWGTWGLLRDSLTMSLQAVPASIDPQAVRAYLGRLPGVATIHDLHIWPMSTTEVALTGHLVMPGGHPGDYFLNETAHELGHRFGVHHATLQIETDPGIACPLEPDALV